MSALTEPKDWTNLALVIQYAESLGGGKTVFRLSGGRNYGICNTADMPFDRQLTGRMQLASNLLGNPEKKYVVYRTRDRST